MSWLILAPHHRLRNFSQPDVSLSEGTSGNHNVTINSNKFFVNFLWNSLLHWEIVWRNAPRILWDFGSALPFQTRLTQTKPVLPLSNEQGSQVKDQGRRQCCHNKHKNFPIGLHVMYLYFPDTPLLLSGLYFMWMVNSIGNIWFLFLNDAFLKASINWEICFNCFLMFHRAFFNSVIDKTPTHTLFIQHYISLVFWFH